MNFLGDHTSKRLRRQRGLTLIESALVLTIAALTMVFFVRMLSDNAEVMKAKGVSEKMVEVFDAAGKYIKVNNAALVNTISPGSLIVIPVGRPDVSSSVPSGPAAGLPSLQGGGFLSPGFIDRNSYNQRHALIVRNVTVPGIGQRLDGLITTYGGMKIPDRQLQKIAGFIGAAGGYVPKSPLPSDAGQIVGSYGGWRSPLSNWGSSSNPAEGSIVATLAFEAGEDGIAPYLYRMDIGKAEANRMQTNIDMNNFDLRNVKAVTAGTSGEIDMTGKVVGSDNVEANKDLKAGIDIWAGRNITAGGVVQGSVVQATSYVQTPTVYANDVNASNVNSTNVNSTTVNSVNVNAQGTVTGTNVTANGSLRSNGSLDVAQRTNTNDLHTNFLDANGLYVYGIRGLQPGHYTSLESLLPKQIAKYSYLVTNNSWVPKPSCPANSVPRIMIYRQQDTATISVAPGNGVSTMYGDYVSAVYAVDGGYSWTVVWGGMMSQIAPSTALAQTFCDYD